MKHFQISNTSLQEDKMFNGSYLFLFFTSYALIIMIMGGLTLQQVRERLADHADHYRQLLQRLSKVAICHTIVFSLYLCWQVTNSFLSYYTSIPVLMVVTDVVSFLDTNKWAGLAWKNQYYTIRDRSLLEKTLEIE